MIKSRFSVVACAGCLALVYVATVLYADDTPNDQQESKPQVDETRPPDAAKKPSVWMRMKMKCTENVLAGLAAGDFELIQENAERMNRFSQLERWARGGSDEYQGQLRFFRHANRALVRAAKNENLDGSTLAFMQLTASCVNCHRVVRDQPQPAAGNVPARTHEMVADTEYYLNGPQQAQPSDGTFGKGTNVRIIKQAGSYTLVESADGVRAYVSSAALARRETDPD